MQNIMQANEQSKPWYKYPLVWMMIFIPFTAVIMGVVMIWLAIDTDDGLVVDDYYKQGLEINRVIERDKKAAELGLNAVIEFDNSTRLIKLVFNKGLLESYPVNLPLQLQHATRENSDITIILNHGMANQYVGQLKQSISEGIWYFKISGKDGDAGWKLNTRSRVQAQNTIQLQSQY